MRKRKLPSTAPAGHVELPKRGRPSSDSIVAVATFISPHQRRYTKITTTERDTYDTYTDQLARGRPAKNSSVRKKR